MNSPLTTLQKHLTDRPAFVPGRSDHYPGQKGCYYAQDWTYMAVDGTFVTVPRGYWYNGGSIPSLLWAATFSPFDTDIIDWFGFHDFSYLTHCVDKTVADHTLQRGLELAGFGKRAALVAGAVATFGNKFWSRDLQDLRYLNFLRQALTEEGRDLKTFNLR